MVVISEEVSNSLIIEWSEAEAVNDHKKDQLARYSQLVTDDLTVILGIPPEAAKTNDVVLILPPIAVNQFSALLKERNWQFPVLSFGFRADEYLLQTVECAFRETSTDAFFARGVRVQRIPRRYLPFALDQISLKEIVPFVVRHLIALLAKAEEQFTIDEFCSGYVPVWEIISVDKQNELKAKTKELLNNLLRSSAGRGLLDRIADNPPTWAIMDPERFRGTTRSLRRAFNSFIMRYRGSSYQLELPEPPDDKPEN